MGISPIFNVADLYPYVESETEQSTNDFHRETGQHIKWQKKIPIEEKL